MSTTLEAQNQTPTPEASDHEQSGDLEEARINTFSALAPLLRVEQFDVTLDTRAEDPKREAIEGFHRAPSRSDDPTIHLVPGFETGFNGPLSFTPFKSQSGKSSRHGVFFGSLGVAGSQRLDLAIKPFAKAEGQTRAEDLCFADFIGNTLANNLKLGGLKPVGIITGDDENLYSLTMLERSLVTFDSIDWTEFLSDYDNSPGMQDLWLKAARSLAVLHSMGDSSHRDLFPRNIATNPEGQVFPIDWEVSHLNNHAYRDLEARFGSSWVDLRQLAEGMAYPTNLPGVTSGCEIFFKTEGDWWQAYDMIFFAEYKEWRINLASVGNHHMRRLAETHEELKQLEQSLRAGLESIRSTFTRAA